MPQWLQALMDIALLTGEVILGGWMLVGLLALLARHTSTARIWHALAVVAFGGCTFAFCVGRQWHLPEWGAAGVALVATLLATMVLCSTTLRQAAVIAILIVPLFGGMHVGVATLANRLIPDRWTFVAQYRLAETEINKAIDPNSPIFRLRENLARIVDALVKLTMPGQAELMQSDVAVGLSELRARRLAATNQEEIAANRLAYEALRQELLGTHGSTGSVTVAEIRDALAQMQKRKLPGEPVPDLDAALSNLWINLSSTNGMQTFYILGHTLAEVQREMDAMKTNEILAAAAQAAPSPLGTNATAIASGLLNTSAVHPEHEAAGITNHAQRLPGTTDGVAVASRSITSTVAVSRGPAVTYATPPAEMHITSVVSRGSRKGFVVCNGRIVEVGGQVVIETQGVEMRFKLEAIDDATPRWSRVRPSDAILIPFGRR
ncbi:MAG: hypothetical protein K8T26_15015 [Lentisphaerae bacterium]|nr:hypothetical protein [Lentisphaerota bacterium]